MSTSNSREPVYRFRLKGPGVSDPRELETEAEALALANCMRDRDPVRYRDVEVERSEKVGRGHRYWLKREGEWRDSSYVGRGLSGEEIRALEAEQARKAHSGPQTFIGTFTASHFHPNTGQCLKNARIEFQAASHDDANDLMWDAFGDKGWWDAHPLDDIREHLEGGSPWTGGYYRVSWPTPPAPPGVTVTLRVVLTEARAAQPDLWIAGRCVLHRPVPEATVQPGAGVTTEDGAFPESWRSRGADGGVGHAGLVLRVRFFRREDAERAVSADPEHVSIVPDTESLGTFRRPPKVFADEPHTHRNKVRLTGAFDINVLYEIAEAIPSFKPAYALASKAWGEVGDDDALVELDDNRVVAVHVLPEK